MQGRMILVYLSVGHFKRLLTVTRIFFVSYRRRLSFRLDSSLSVFVCNRGKKECE